MRILYVVHQFFPEYPTGTERFTLDLARSMQRAGHRVRVVCWSRGAFPAGRDSADHHWRDYTVDGVPVTAFWQKSYHWRVHYDFEDSADLRAAAERLLDEGRYDVVHVSHLQRTAVIVRAAARRGIPYVATLTDFFTLCHRSTMRDAGGRNCEGPRGGRECSRRCAEAWMPKEWPLDRRKAYDELLDGAAALFSPSEHLAGVFESERGRARGRVRVIRYGISRGRRSSAASPAAAGSRPIVFGFLGALSPHKGPLALVRAFRKVASPRARLELHGFGEDQEYMLDVAALAYGDPRVSLKGPYRSPAELDAVLARLDAACVPSLWPDNYPLVIMEAHARGVPVLGARIGAIPEAVRDGVDGLLLPPGDEDAWAAALERLCARPWELSSLRAGIAPPRLVEEAAAEYEAVYEGLPRRSKRGARK